MQHFRHVKLERLSCGVMVASALAAVMIVTTFGVRVGAQAQAITPQNIMAPNIIDLNSTAMGSPGAAADLCGIEPPAAGRGGAEGQAAGAGRGALPIYPWREYPVTLPAVSMMGARNDLPNPYRLGVHWGKLPGDRKWGSTAGVVGVPDGTIWAIDRCGNAGAGGATCADSPLDPILHFDQSGKLLGSMGKGTIVAPHKLSVDREGNVWIADNGSAPNRGNVVLKYSPDGKLLMTLGTPGKVGTGPNEFDRPTQVAVAPNGDIFVADGHSGGGQSIGNARIMKYDKTGKFIKEIGKKGMGPVEFDVIHDIVFDPQGRLLVADRQNNRIQIIDQDGKFIAEWKQFSRPSGIAIVGDTIVVTDSESRDGRSNTGQNNLSGSAYMYNLGARRGIRVGSLRTGQVTAFIPDPCPYPYYGPGWEGVGVDTQGNIYAADYMGTIRKFVKK